MIKCFCDKCGIETKEVHQVLDEEYITDSIGRKQIALTKSETHLCEKCFKKFKQSHLDICDFLKLSDEELDFLFSTLKVGDQVITSTGKVGTITSICTCDRCKERGFYEPKVEVKIGTGEIYITDNDKRNNFRSFYKIGDQVFGNIDEDDVLYDIESTKEQVNELRLKLIHLEVQLDVLRELKRN